MSHFVQAAVRVAGLENLVFSPYHVPTLEEEVAVQKHCCLGMYLANRSV
jgi:hypothetical protein